MISVVIPVYNVSPYLQRCIDSILQQTFSDIEVILVDDGSTDDSGIICYNYFEAFERRGINCIVVHKKNGGLSSARNTGIKVSTRKYISFVDSDDWIHPCFLEYLYNAINTSDADLSACMIRKTEVFDVVNGMENENYSNDIVIVRDKKYACMLDESSYAGYACNKMYSLKMLKEHNVLFDENVFLGEDSPFVAQYLTHCHTIAVVQKQLYNYYFRPGGLSKTRSFSPRQLTLLNAREMVLDILKKEDPGSFYKEMAAYADHVIKFKYLLSAVKGRYPEEYIKIEKKYAEMKRDLKYLQNVPAQIKVKIYIMYHFPNICGFMYRRFIK